MSTDVGSAGADAEPWESVVDALMPAVRANLEALVRIPSCAFPGFPPEPVTAAAQATASILLAAGAETAQLVDVPGAPPAVVAEFAGPADAPLVLLYAHYDVQPAGDPAAWTSPPFEPTERAGRLFGRGAADDKSGIVIHAAALTAVRSQRGALPCRVRVVVEGDEECGGSLESYVREHPELADVDAVVVADVGNLRLGEPTFTTALRGLADCTVTVRTLAGPVHSGMFGGPAPDALMVLVRLLATLQDDHGDTSIDGLASGSWDGADYPEYDFRRAAGVLEGQPLVGTGSIADRLFARPVVSVVGLDAPPVQGAINAVVPFARARVSLRVPPGQDARAAGELLVAHLRDRAPDGIAVQVEPGMSGSGVAVPVDGPAYTAARRAMERAYGREIQRIGSGGTIPLVAALHEVAPRAELLLFGAQDPQASIHAPDESVHLGELRAAVLAETLFLAQYR